MNSLLLVTDGRQYENAPSPSPYELEWILVPGQPSEKISAFVCIAVVPLCVSVSHAHSPCGGQQRWSGTTSLWSCRVSAGRAAGGALVTLPLVAKEIFQITPQIFLILSILWAMSHDVAIKVLSPPHHPWYARLWSTITDKSELPSVLSSSTGTSSYKECTGPFVGRNRNQDRFLVCPQLRCL